MTTTVKVCVNGRYRATVIMTDADGSKQDPVIVEGNYEGSPNPTGERAFQMYHPAVASFAITEEQVPIVVKLPDEPAVPAKQVMAHDDNEAAKQVKADDGPSPERRY